MSQISKMAHSHEQNKKRKNPIITDPPNLQNGSQNTLSNTLSNKDSISIDRNSSTNARKSPTPAKKEINLEDAAAKNKRGLGPQLKNAPDSKAKSKFNRNPDDKNSKDPNQATRTQQPNVQASDRNITLASQQNQARGLNNTTGRLEEHLSKPVNIETPRNHSLNQRATDPKNNGNRAQFLNKAEQRTISYQKPTRGKIMNLVNSKIMNHQENPPNDKNQKLIEPNIANSKNRSISNKIKKSEQNNTDKPKARIRDVSLNNNDIDIDSQNRRGPMIVARSKKGGGEDPVNQHSKDSKDQNNTSCGENIHKSQYDMDKFPNTNVDIKSKYEMAKISVSILPSQQTLKDGPIQKTQNGKTIILDKDDDGKSGKVSPTKGGKSRKGSPKKSPTKMVMNDNAKIKLYNFASDAKTVDKKPAKDNNEHRTSTLKISRPTTPHGRPPSGSPLKIKNPAVVLPKDRSSKLLTELATKDAYKYPGLKEPKLKASGATISQSPAGYVESDGNEMSANDKKLVVQMVEKKGKPKNYSIMSRQDKALEKQSDALPTTDGGYHAGPELIDTRKKKIHQYQREAKKLWDGYFDKQKEVRWDMFEDYLIDQVQVQLMANKEEGYGFCRKVYWRKYLKFVYETVGKKAKSNEILREQPEIPFYKDKNELLVYKGTTVRADDFVSYNEQEGFTNTFWLKIREFICEDGESIEPLPFRRYHLDRVKYDYCCGSVYYGNFRNGYKQGKGCLKLMSKDLYNGEFNKGKKEGHGKMIYKCYQKFTKLVYEGSFKNDLRHGYGSLFIDTDSKFSGDWEFGLQKYGVYNGHDGQNYVGSWNGGKINQEGVLKHDGKEFKGIMENGEFVTGQIKNDATGNQIVKGEGNIGKTTRIENYNFIYEGDMLDDKEHGYGVKTWTNGVVYKGTWVNGKENGQGEWSSPIKAISKKEDDVGVQTDIEEILGYDKYKGNFLAGQFHGKGEMYWQNGNIYLGNFKNGLYNGKGRVDYKALDIQSNQNIDKLYYEGDFRHGIYHGQGKIEYFNGDIYIGGFCEGKRQGKGKLVMKSKMDDDKQQEYTEYYDGDWFRDKYEGYGVFNHSIKGVMYQGYWRYGKMHGKGSYRIEGHQDLVDGIFCDGDLLEIKF